MSLGAKGWLRSATVDDAGRLIIPGKPNGRAADLVFDPDGLLVRRGDDSVMLAWSDYRDYEPFSGPLRGWGIGPLFSQDVRGVIVAGVLGGPIGMQLFASRMNLPIGVALFVPDSLLPVDGDADGQAIGVPALQLQAARAIPVWTLRLGAPAPEPIDTVAMLCRVLAERPSLRPRLADRARSERLARDLAPGAQRRITPSSGLRRASLEVDAALVRSGRAHRILGRPVPGDRTESDDHVVSDVRALLDASPFADTFHVSDEQVAKRVHEHYLDVAPWPFAALTTD